LAPADVLAMDKALGLQNGEPHPSFNYGQTPDEVVKNKAMAQTPRGYPMHIKSQSEWAVIAKAVNKGIDAHLEGFTKSTFDPKTGRCIVHPQELHILVRRLGEEDDEESQSLRSAILETLDIEEI